MLKDTLWVIPSTFLIYLAFLPIKKNYLLNLSFVKPSIKIFSSMWVYPTVPDNLLVKLMYFRRDLALHLKSLMGPWWFSQFDPVPEVAQCAKRSLQVFSFAFILTFFMLKVNFIKLPIYIYIYLDTQTHTHLFPNGSKHFCSLF